MELFGEEKLVSTDWVADHGSQSDVVLLEVDVDTSSYDQGHIPGAIGWNWQTQLQDQRKRDLLGPEEFQKFARESGIHSDSRVVLYGDNNNWFAAWALWQLEYYGFENTVLMDGGREKWMNENRPMTDEVPDVQQGDFVVEEPDESIRAYRQQIEEQLSETGFSLVDVRCSEEYRGEIIAPEGMSETAQRGGHIPGAINIPWKEAVSADGTFKDRSELEELYRSRGVDPDGEVVTYCRIGERSSHTWFVLHHLLGFENVKNYDGSWTEWGNLVGNPIETGEEIKGHPASAGVCKE